jgi:hypothetical protein
MGRKISGSPSIYKLIIFSPSQITGTSVIGSSDGDETAATAK